MARFEIQDDGIPGLTLALRLRLKGHDVGLVTSAERVNPRETFTLPAPYRDLFLKSGSPIESCLPLVAAPGPVVHVDGQPVELPSVGPHSLALADVIGDRARQWRHLMHDAADIWGTLRTGSRSSRHSALRRARRSLRDPELVAVFVEYLEQQGLDARHVNDSALVLPYLDQTFGRWRFERGMQGLESELRSRCAALGVDALTGGRSVRIQEQWVPAFALPTRPWRRFASMEPSGLPWIGMAADFIADGIGRATPRVSG